MSSLVVDLILLGFTYVVLIYFVATLTKARQIRKRNDGEDDGGIENITEPKIDLPPGVVWPTSSPTKRREKNPVNY
ncbi:hypothetical protein Belba_1221 [Belliella baltica DSM 15883]|uniref:Uncharacterized protein n=1 Tax=Belliella baltica (strain DSM 15883 / CIP 108006 / LMG 21964 / BA134) TaxID=866536 RepID=I3Z3N8_BELBD|nr:hypothetical protein [Belliella baltica]AFL83856.1 hypothetical protein Belba_1221 [Belliella baltica DSM 15883]